MREKLSRLLERLQLRVSWLLASLFGTDVLTEAELSSLKESIGIPPASNAAERFYVLGRLKAILGPKKYANLTREALQSYLDSMDFSTMDAVALDQVKLKVSQHVRSVAQDVVAGVYGAIVNETNRSISAASIEQEITDQVIQALYQGDSFTTLTSKLSSMVKENHEAKWEMVSRTELHRAKVTGIAQAIVQKQGPMAAGDGPDSLVSIVPHPGTCLDCAKHYLDSSGNPKVFVLRDLLTNGSNADPGVVHSKKSGIHTHWKTTLPPLHPHCACDVHFIPSGYGWVDGVLRVVDQSLVKALKGTMTPNSTQSNPGAVNAPGLSSNKPGNIKGVSVAGSGAGAPKPDKPTGPHVEYDYVPASDGKPSGPGWEKTESGKSWRRPKGMGGSATPKDSDESSKTSPSGEPMETSATLSEAAQFRAAKQVKLAHMKNGSFGESRPLGKGEAGSFESYKVAINGNGNALVKPVTKELKSRTGTKGVSGSIIAGELTTPPGTAHIREESAYLLHEGFGLSGFVPETSARPTPKGEASVQSWAENTVTLSKITKAYDNNLKEPKIRYATGDRPGPEWVEDGPFGWKREEVSADKKNKGNNVKALLASAPKQHHEHLKQKMADGAVMQILMNHGDGHEGNIIVPQDGSDILFIDNSAAFGHSMWSTSSVLHRDMHNAGMKLKVSDTLMARFKNTSYQDINRMTGGKLEPSAVAHTYLRMKYMEHLQTVHGHLPYEKFKPVMTSLSGDVQPRMAFWGSDQGKAIRDFLTADKEGSLAPNQYATWARDFLNNNADDPSVQSILAEHKPHDLFMSGKEYIQREVLPKVENFSPGERDLKPVLPQGPSGLSVAAIKKLERQKRIAQLKADQAAEAKAPTSPSNNEEVELSSSDLLEVEDDGSTIKLSEGDLEDASPSFSHLPKRMRAKAKENWHAANIKKSVWISDVGKSWS